MTAKITVIIVNYNSDARLARAVACLAAQTFKDFEVIIADNASSDASLEFAQPPSLSLRIVRNDANLGFAKGNNEAAKLASGEWLALLNPDAYPEPDWLEQLVKAAERYPNVDAFGSTQIDANDPTKLDGAGDAYQAFGLPYRGHFGWPITALPEEGECFAPCAAAALYRRSTFEALGGFDESFFCYGEDVDLGFRLRLAGGRAVQVRAARVLHEGSGITGRRSDFAIYHGHRNRVWTFVKDMPGPIFWPALPFHLILNAALFVRCAAGGTGGAYLRAVADAVRGLGPVWKSRKAVQADRRAGIGEIAHALVWFPLRAFRRKAFIQPVETARRSD
ncbi:MAG: glycosyltransferase family 2 protein [Parvularculaceae bacterium]|nr:glycosyltransferase family 2 protein [Caulobacterales bacterium]